MTAMDLFQLQGQSPHFATFRDSKDIYPTSATLYGMNGRHFVKPLRPSPGQCLGPAKKEGRKTAQWVLKQNEHIVPNKNNAFFNPKRNV
jgi:hypothetical protein